MKEQYTLMIGFRQELQDEGIDPYFIELWNKNRCDDNNEKILKWTSTKEEAEEFAKIYIEKHDNVNGIDYHEC